MDYQCDRDIGPNKDLTVEALRLFQRFRQSADEEWLLRTWDDEVHRHLKLCELTILYFAGLGFYWCDLPLHPIAEVNNHVFNELRDRGFSVERNSTGRREEVEDRSDRSKRLHAVVVQTVWTARWLHAGVSNEQLNLEWQRREALENEDLERNPPRPKSSLEQGKITSSGAIWSAVLDDKYLVEVQQIHQRAFLLLFTFDGTCVHREETCLSYGALFGPDSGDVAEWTARAMAIVDALRQQ